MASVFFSNLHNAYNSIPKHNIEMSLVGGTNHIISELNVFTDILL